MSKLLNTNDKLLLTYDMRRTDRIRQRLQQAWDQKRDLDRQWIEQLTLRPPKERKEQ